MLHKTRRKADVRSCHAPDNHRHGGNGRGCGGVLARQAAMAAQDQPPVATRPAEIDFIEWELGSPEAQERWQRVLERFNPKHPNILVANPLSWPSRCVHLARRGDAARGMRG